ncbi:VOC family protein [Guggenheimella bovis]
MNKMTMAIPFFPVTDLEEAIRFYESLGFLILQKDPEKVIIRQDEVMIVLVKKESSPQELLIGVENVEELYSKLLQTMERAIYVREEGMHFGKHDFSLRDPFMNIITFYERD